MFETIEKPYKINADEECFDYNADDVLDVITSCEQEIIKRFEWLKKAMKERQRVTNMDNFDIDDLINRSQNLPIEKIEEELK